MHRSHRSPVPVLAGRALALACLAFGLGGCVFSPLQQPPAGGRAQPEATKAQAPAPSRPPARAQARAHAKPPPQRRQKPVPKTSRKSGSQGPAAKPTVLLLAGDAARYGDTVAALQSALRARGFDVVKVASRDLKWALYALGPHPQVFAVAVGDEAAAARARRLRVPTVYCEIAEPNAGTRAGMHGVSALPPLALQLQAWKRVSPELKRVALILGAGREATAAKAKLAARKAHLTLTYRSVSSDQEAMYVFKRLAPQIDGLWLLPDTILSPRAIKTMLGEAMRDKVQSLVFTPSLFRWGALLSVGSTKRNVASTVAEVLRRLADEPRSVPATTPLSALELRVNESLAASFGIHTPSASWIVRAGPGS